MTPRCSRTYSVIPSRRAASLACPHETAIVTRTPSTAKTPDIPREIQLCPPRAPLLRQSPRGPMRSSRHHRRRRLCQGRLYLSGTRIGASSAPHHQRRCHHPQIPSTRRSVATSQSRLSPRGAGPRQGPPMQGSRPRNFTPIFRHEPGQGESPQQSGNAVVFVQGQTLFADRLAQGPSPW